MRRLLVRVSTVALAVIAVFANPVGAQRVLGVGDDALVLPRGVFRFRTLGQWTWFNERYGMDTPGRPNGALEPLGIDFTLDTIGVRQFPNLASLQLGIQQLTANPNWFASLGNTVVNLRDHVAAFPFVFEAGLSKRFSVGIQIPYVHTQTSAFFNVNSSGTNGHLGFNPAFAVTAAQTRLSVRDAQTILTAAPFGIQADPLQSVSRSHIGDIDIGGKFSLFDSFGGNTEARMSPHGLNFRASVGGIFRIPSGQIESPNNFIDLGTGRGAKAVEGRLFSDLLVGSHFWESFIVRLNKPFSDTQTMRILDLPNEELAPVYRRQSVSRTLGTAFEFETAPRIVVNDFLAVSAWYMYRHKQQDHYSGTFTIPAATTGFADITIDASTLDLETEQTEHRFGGGLSFSNLYSFDQGKARVPFEVTYLHWQTMGVSGVNMAEFFTNQIQLRLYARNFGGT